MFKVAEITKIILMTKTIDSSFKKQLNKIIFYLFFKILFTEIKYLFFLHTNNVYEILINQKYKRKFNIQNQNNN
jgi:hypothetical protein